MKQSRKNKSFLNHAPLLALLIVFLLSACAGRQQEMTVVPDYTLPSIGAAEVPEPTGRSQTEPAPESENAPTETDPIAILTSEEPSEATESDEASTEMTETAPVRETTAPTATTATQETTAPAATTAPPETTVPSTTTASETAATTASVTEATSGVRVWMGDSRFVGIQNDVDYDKEKDVFISRWGKGYDWMLETAFPEFEKLAASGTKINICYWSLGANDITNEPSERNMELAAMFAEEVGKLIAAHPETTFYLLSYGPVGEEGMDPNNIPDCAAYNKALRLFTDRVLELTGMIYLDQGEYLEQTGFKVYDGCHYDAETNKRAYDYVLMKSGQDS